MALLCLICLAFLQTLESRSSIPNCEKNTSLCQDIPSDLWNRNGRILQRVAGRVIFNETTLKMDATAKIDFSEGGSLIVTDRLRRNGTVNLGKMAAIVCHYGSILPERICEIRIRSEKVRIRDHAKIFMGGASLSMGPFSEADFGKNAMLIMTDRSTVDINGIFGIRNDGFPTRISVGYNASLITEESPPKTDLGELSFVARLSGWVEIERYGQLSLCYSCLLDMVKRSELHILPEIHLSLKSAVKKDYSIGIPHNYTKYPYRKETHIYLLPDYNLIPEGRENVKIQWKHMTYTQCVECFKHYITEDTGFTYSFNNRNSMGTCRIGSNGLIYGKTFGDPFSNLGSLAPLSGMKKSEFEAIEGSCITIHDEERRPIKSHSYSDYYLTPDKNRKSLNDKKTKFEFIHSKGRFFILPQKDFQPFNPQKDYETEKLALTLTSDGSLTFKRMNESDLKQTWKLVGREDDCRMIAWNGECLELFAGVKSSEYALRSSKNACMHSESRWVLSSDNKDSDSNVSSEIYLSEDSQFVVNANRGTTIKGAVVFLHPNARLIIDSTETNIGYQPIERQQARSVQDIEPEIEVSDGSVIFTNGRYGGTYNVSGGSKLELIGENVEILESTFDLKDVSILALSGDSILIKRSNFYLKGRSQFICRAESISIKDSQVEFEREGRISCNELNHGNIDLFGRIVIPYNTRLAFKQNASFTPWYPFAQGFLQNKCPEKWTQLDGSLCLYITKEMKGSDEWEKEIACYQVDGIWKTVQLSIDELRDEIKSYFNGKSEVKACTRQATRKASTDDGIDFVRIDFNLSTVRNRDFLTELELVFEGDVQIDGRLSVIGEHRSRGACQVSFKKNVMITRYSRLIIDLLHLETQAYPVPMEILLHKNEKYLHEIFDDE